jgi:hypothetical protein
LEHFSSTLLPFHIKLFDQFIPFDLLLILQLLKLKFSLLFSSFPVSKSFNSSHFSI